jgi:hypothetical protein
VAPQGRMRDIATEETGDGGSRTEEHALAAVVAAPETRRAGVAGDTGLDRDAIAWLQMRYRRMDGNDL